MGYILPITQYEYANYQNRDIKKDYDFHYVEKPFKIKLDMQQQFNYDDDFTNEMVKDKLFLHRKTKITNSRQERLIAKITGKGSLFNVKI